MQLTRPFIRLPYQFDAERLRADVDALPDEAWRGHPTGHVGNSAVLLVSTGGDPTDDTIGGVQAPTPWLDQSPYLAQVVAAFGVPVGRTRLMRIDAGGEATPHFDAHLYWKDRVRIHVPIITTPDVTFVSGSASTHMAAGESWVFDTLAIHNVVNPGEQSRVHLVVDTVGTPQLWEQIRSGADPIEVPFDPSRRPVVLPEQTNLPDVMPPGQQQAIAEDLFELLPDGDAAASLRSACTGFLDAWKTLWALHGPSPHAAGYRREVDRFATELGGLPDARLPYNGASAASLAMSWLARSALTDAPDPAASRVVVSEPAPLEPKTSPVRAADPRFDRPVIIVSPPRAGSTLLFETLGNSPDVFSIGGESHQLIEQFPALRPDHHDWHSNELSAADATDAVVAALRDAWFERLVDRNGQPPPMNATGLRFLEKTPKNALRIEFLDTVFPDARYVFLSRGPRDEISSMIDAWRSGGFVTYPELPGWTGLPWSLLLTPGWQDLVGKSVQEVCAAQWEYTTNKILDDLERVAPGRWTVAGYDRLVADPLPEIERICAAVDLSWEHDLADPLPLSRHTLTPPNPDKWRMNSTELNEVLPRLKATAERAAAVASTAAGTAPAATSRPKRPAPTAGGKHPLASVHTGTVPELLAKANANVLLSTYQSGRMITLRSMDGVLNTHFTAMPRPMGMAAKPGGHLAVGTANEVWTYRDQPAVAAKIEPAGAYSSAYVLRQRHVTGDISIHEMEYDADGELWIVATKFSCLATLDADHSFVPRWRPPFVTGLSADDRCHLNGMALRDGRPRYVTAFSESDQAQGWRDTKAFGGLIIDVDADEIMTRGLCMPHSPRWHRDQLWVLESGKGSLSRIDPDTGDAEVVTTLPGFTRGMEFIGRYALIGLSQVRESVFAGLPLTQSTEPRHSGLWIVDLETAATVGFVRFDGLVQEVFDLQVITGDGHAHLVDLDAEQHVRSFVVPTQALASAG
ncbi:uncharacterized protein (TIGR03032 family) [Ilumatobacter fluminis]|uniref:Uncharacterized protein (TIGR03032 family) n=1 Tax=Ilumatobacter fluminis TaxID=467091 RepID=A0A4R7I1U5_9ACTN|nr:TIGR03032 family protein [Ilumatobacter fluminis]TDT17552.1 uncharacterized protein (TIGR03032 family) [Ilumatobacter fluminis]